MTDPETRDRMLAEIAELREGGVRIVLVHGGGPAIAEILAEVGLESEFVGEGRRYGSGPSPLARRERRVAP